MTPQESAEQIRDAVAGDWDQIVEAASAPPAPGDVWLTRRELAERWKLPPATLAQWASQRRGPRSALLGRRRYRLAVISWETDRFAREAAGT